MNDDEVLGRSGKNLTINAGDFQQESQANRLRGSEVIVSDGSAKKNKNLIFSALLLMSS